MLTTMLQQIGRSNPELLGIISQVQLRCYVTPGILDISFLILSQNQEAFIRMINEGEPGEGGEGELGGLAGPGDGAEGLDAPGVIQVSPQDKEAIERV